MSAASATERASARAARLTDVSRRLTAARARQDRWAEARLVRVQAALMRGAW